MLKPALCGFRPKSIASAPLLADDPVQRGDPSVGEELPVAAFVRVVRVRVLAMLPPAVRWLELTYPIPTPGRSKIIAGGGKPGPAPRTFGYCDSRAEIHVAGTR
jgi:hypothetical protein